MNTIHSYTNDQHILDVRTAKAICAARALRDDMIPTSTGAAKALSEVIPSLKGKFDGQSIRVPTMDVSIIDLTVETEKPATKEAIHAAMKKRRKDRSKEFSRTRIVRSSRAISSATPHSATFDSTMTQTMGDNFAKVFAWYDNEWGFSSRMVELTELVARKL